MRLRAINRSTVAAVATIALLGAGTAAQADRKPNDRERDAIDSALERKGFDCFGMSGCHRSIRVSTRNERWAASYIKGSGVQPTNASLKRKHHRWRIHQIGNGGGCDVPKKVAKDLNLVCY